MEGPTGAREGYYFHAGKWYAEIVVDTKIVRVGLALLLRSDVARITAALGAVRVVLGYLPDSIG